MQSRPTLLTRLTATLAVLLVLALTAFSASPELHSRLHDHGTAPLAAHHDRGAPAAADDGDEGCVVTLFAQGLVLALALVALFFTGEILRDSAFPTVRRIAPPCPAYLHLPPQAPPHGLS
jgi:hypothetical protein